jgi:hypothetical protein
MKGSVVRPVWPVPAAKAATRPATNPTRQQPLRELGAEAEPPGPPINPSNEITLSLLDDYPAARAKGYDPYNASAAAQRPKDAWQRKRKRD